MDVRFIQAIKSHQIHFQIPIRKYMDTCSELWQIGLRNRVFRQEKQQLESGGYCILERMSDPLNFEAELREACVTAFNEGSSFLTQTIAEFFNEMKNDFQENKRWSVSRIGIIGVR